MKFLMRLPCNSFISIYRCPTVRLPLLNSNLTLAQQQGYPCAAVNNFGLGKTGKTHCKYLQNPLSVIEFHADLTNLTKHTSLSLVCAIRLKTFGKAASCENSFRCSLLRDSCDLCETNCLALIVRLCVRQINRRMANASRR